MSDPFRFYSDSRRSSKQTSVVNKHGIDMSTLRTPSSQTLRPIPAALTTSRDHHVDQFDMQPEGFDRSQSLAVQHGGQLADDFVEAEFVCIHCQEVSRCRSDQKRHMLNHAKPFLCDIHHCERGDRGFATENDLQRHQTHTHGLGILHDDWICASVHCLGRRKIWRRKDNFIAHIHRMHPDEDEWDLIRRSVYIPQRPPPETSSPPPLASQQRTGSIVNASSMPLTKDNHPEYNVEVELEHGRDLASYVSTTSEFLLESPQIPQYTDANHSRNREFDSNVPIDSGYGSMPEKTPRVIQQDDGVVSMRSIVSNGSRVRLPRHEEEHLIAAFSGDLCQDIDVCGDIDSLGRVIARLPSLLRTFSIKLAKNATCRAESDAVEFVRRQRRGDAYVRSLQIIMELSRITQSYQENKLPEKYCADEDLSNTPVNGMSLAEKMALWDVSEENSSHLGLEEDDQQFEEIIFPPRYQEVRSFLLHSRAYDWLLKKCQSSALLTDGSTMELFSQPIADMLSSMISSESHLYQVTFDVEWDLPGFLIQQQYDTTLEVAMERAITLTGSIVSAQALSCLDYMCQTWPSTGNEVVRTLQGALHQQDLPYSSCLSDGTEILVSFGKMRTTIVARGDQTALTELCEQLSWLSAALRPSSISTGVCLSTPKLLNVCIDNAALISVPSIRVCVGFNMDPCVPTSLGGTCWYALFCNPVVVTGFPILARANNEQGLELPLDVMTTLAESQFATHYDATLILKGLFTILIPTRRTERTITWHFISSTGAKRLPYNAFRESLSGCGVDEMNIHTLETRRLRNFVGWTPDIARHIGTQDVKYEAIDWSGAMKCSAGLAVEQKLAVSASKVLGVSGSIIRGDRDKPSYVKVSAYSLQIDNARDWHVILYDTESQRGWLTDGASALLHLVRTQVSREPYSGYFNEKQFNQPEFVHPTTNGGPEEAVKILKDFRNMKHVILKEFVAYDDQKIPLETHDTATPFTNEVPQSEIYKTICFKDLVSQTWSTLEQIYDRQTEISGTHISKQLPNLFKKTLEGYEFMGIVVGRHRLTRRSIGLHSNGAAWEHFAKRINAITLFSRCFGEIYTPSTNGGKLVCKDWMTVPSGHEFLVAPISLLRSIQQRSKEEGEVETNSSEIAEGFLWSPSKDAFHSCGTTCGHNLLDRVQKFHKDNPTRGSDIFATITGAVLFGTSSALKTERLRVLPPTREAGSISRDSGISSVLPSLFSNHSTLSTSGESSVVPPITPSWGTQSSASARVTVNAEQHARKFQISPPSSFDSFPRSETEQDQATPSGMITTDASNLQATTLDGARKKRKRSALGPCKRLAIAIPSRWKNENGT